METTAESLFMIILCHNYTMLSRGGFVDKITDKNFAHRRTLSEILLFDKILLRGGPIWFEEVP